MRREILIALFILLLIFIYTEARAIALKSGLTICPDESTQTDECLPAEKLSELTQVTGLVEGVKCLEDNPDFQKFQIHLVPLAKFKILSQDISQDDFTFTLPKNTNKQNFQKTVYFIKGETPTLWLRRSESAWKIAQVKWFGKDLQNHSKGPPTCNL